MLKENRPTKDFAGSTRQRALAEQRLRDKLGSNQAIADANKLPPGPKFTAGTDPGCVKTHPAEKSLE